jgi:small-conductance mechanosensitive channel
VDDDLIRTLILTGGTVVSAAFGALATVKGVRRQRRKRREVDPEEREAVQRYANDPGQFVKDVLESNRQQTVTIGQLTARIEKTENRVLAVERQLTRVTRTLRAVREAFRDYIRAVRDSWGKDPKPPAVSDHIRDLLAEDDLDDTFNTGELDAVRNAQEGD